MNPVSLPAKVDLPIPWYPDDDHLAYSSTSSTPSLSARVGSFWIASMIFCFCSSLSSSRIPCFSFSDASDVPSTDHPAIHIIGIESYRRRLQSQLKQVIVRVSWLAVDAFLGLEDAARKDRRLVELPDAFDRILKH